MATKEITVDDIVGTLESFKFSSKNIEEKISFISTMFDVNTVESEVVKSIKWIAELILGRIEDKEPCPDCFGTGCQRCFHTGKKR